MVSFTGSTAPSSWPRPRRTRSSAWRRELGGKSPNIICRRADFEEAVRKGVEELNSSQSCDAHPHAGAARHDEGARSRQEGRRSAQVGDPRNEDWRSARWLAGADFDPAPDRERHRGRGATLSTGGPGRPEHLNRSYYIAAGRVRPSRPA